MAVTTDQNTEQAVIETLRGGDRNAFGKFVEQNAPWVRSVVFGVLGNREQLDDVCQQAWTNVWQQVGRLRDPKRWRPWLYRLVRNTAVDAGRSQTRRRVLVKRLQAGVSKPAGPEPGDEMIRAEQRALVLEAIRRLPQLYREPFVLRHVEGWKYRQIAEVMDLPTDTIETRLVRARRLLRKALKDKV